MFMLMSYYYFCCYYLILEDRWSNKSQHSFFVKKKRGGGHICNSSLIVHSSRAIKHSFYCTSISRDVLALVKALVKGCISNLI